MGIFDLFQGARTSPRERVEPTLTPVATALDNPAIPMRTAENSILFGMVEGQSFGPSINERTAMAVSAVYRCVTLRGGLVATIPLKIYQRTPEGRVNAPDHRMARLFGVAAYPGRSLTAFAWRELLMANVDLWGNHYSIIRYDNAARVIGFEPVMPWCVSVLRRAGRNLYRCTLEGGEVEYVDQADMLHIPGPGFDGICGVSRIQHNARDAVALAKLLEQQTGRVHENAARPSGVFTVPPGITADGLKKLKQSFAGEYMGRDNAGRVIFADKDSTFTPLQLKPADLATIESRRYQVADISRFFGIPLHMLNEMTGSTSWGSGLAEQTLAFLIFTLDAELSRIEAEINYKLFDSSDFYVEFDRDALLAMDPVKAAEVMQKEISSGVLLIDEYRKLKNRPPVKGGDEPLINSTNVALKHALNPPKPAAPAPKEPPTNG